MMHLPIVTSAGIGCGNRVREGGRNGCERVREEALGKSVFLGTSMQYFEEKSYYFADYITYDVGSTVGIKII